MQVLEPSPKDPYYLHQFKVDLTKDFKERCDKNLNRDTLAKSSYFDGRFKDLDFLVASKKREIEEDIKEELKEFEAQGEFVKVTEKSPKEAVKESRFLGKGLGDDNDDEETIEDEMKRYQAEKKLNTTTNPLKFWKARKDDLPRLAFLARKYLCVQVA